MRVHRFRRRLGRVVFAGACIAAALPARAAAQSNDAMINRAIRLLRSELEKTGELGRCSLGLLALVKSQERLDDPLIKKLTAKVLSHCETAYRPEKSGGEDNYEAACALMALAAIDQKKYLPQISMIADYIMSKQTPVGSWHYTGSSDGDGDTSMTQMALLGLWEAANAGVDIPIEVWDKALYWWCTRQDIGGGFTYHPVDPKDQPRVKQKESYHTLTIAGAACMYICQLKLPLPKRKRGRAELGELLIPVEPEVGPGQYKLKCNSEMVEKALNDANRWVASNFTIANAKGNESLHARLYFIYGLERYGTLAKVDRIANQNWYTAGAEFLRRQQKEDGSWDDGTFGKIPDTSFGLLFLRRSTEQIFKHIVTTYGRGTMLGGRGLPTADSMPDGISTRKKLRYAMALESSVDDVLKAFDDPAMLDVDEAKADQAAAVLENLSADEILKKAGGDPKKLRMLALDPRTEIRRVGLQALVRTKEYRVVPILLKALEDPDPECYRIARDGLRYISRRADSMGLPAGEPAPEQRKAGIAAWQKWFDSLKHRIDADQEFDDPPYPRTAAATPAPAPQAKGN